MKKSWTRLCLLVLAMSSFSRGQSVDPQDGKSNITTNTDSPPAQTPTAAEPTSETLGQASASISPQTNISTMAPEEPSQTITAAEEDDHEKTDEFTEGVTGIPTSTPGSRREGDTVAVTTTVTMATTSTSPKPVTIEEGGQSSWGYVILVLIIVMIIVLCVILYLLRRAARTYSFDLQRPLPVNHHSEPTGTFEPVYLDDLERPAPKDQVNTDDPSPPPVANGTTSTPEEKGPDGESAPQEQEQSDANGLTDEPSPTSNTSPSLGDDPADKTNSPLSSTDLLFDTVGEEIGNNNNPSVCSSDPFVEINLDDPAWCDQLLSSPEAPSSVLPFTPFSFSTSSS